MVSFNSLNDNNNKQGNALQSMNTYLISTNRHKVLTADCISEICYINPNRAKTTLSTTTEK